MNHLEVIICESSPEKQELIIAELSEMGFEGFEETAEALGACGMTVALAGAALGV